MPTSAVTAQTARMIGRDENPAARNARPITYALLVPQSPYSKAAARFQSRLRGRWTPALASRTTSSISCAIGIGSDSRLCARSMASAFSGNAGRQSICKPVTDSRLSLNQRRFCWIRLDLLAQMSDVNTQVLPMLLGLRAPDFAQNVAMRENA